MKNNEIKTTTYGGCKFYTGTEPDVKEYQTNNEQAIVVPLPVDLEEVLKLPIQAQHEWFEEYRIAWNIDHRNQAILARNDPEALSSVQVDAYFSYVSTNKVFQDLKNKIAEQHKKDSLSKKRKIETQSKKKAISGVPILYSSSDDSDNSSFEEIQAKNYDEFRAQKTTLELQKTRKTAKSDNLSFLQGAIEHEEEITTSILDTTTREEILFSSTLENFEQKIPVMENKIDFDTISISNNLTMELLLQKISGISQPEINNTITKAQERSFSEFNFSSSSDSDDSDANKLPLSNKKEAPVEINKNETIDDLLEKKTSLKSLNNFNNNLIFSKEKINTFNKPELQSLICNSMLSSNTSEIQKYINHSNENIKTKDRTDCDSIQNNMSMTKDNLQYCILSDSNKKNITIIQQSDTELEKSSDGVINFTSYNDSCELNQSNLNKISKKSNSCSILSENNELTLNKNTQQLDKYNSIIDILQNSDYICNDSAEILIDDDEIKSQEYFEAQEVPSIPVQHTKIYQEIKQNNSRDISNLEVAKTIWNQPAHAISKANPLDGKGNKLLHPNSLVNEVNTQIDIEKSVLNNLELEEETKTPDIMFVNNNSKHASLYSDIKELLKVLSIPYITAPSEAEAQCAFLSQVKLCDGIISDDSDTFLFGGKNIIRHLFTSKKVVKTINGKKRTIITPKDYFEFYEGDHKVGEAVLNSLLQKQNLKTDIDLDFASTSYSQNIQNNVQKLDKNVEKLIKDKNEKYLLNRYLTENGKKISRNTVSNSCFYSFDNIYTNYNDIKFKDFSKDKSNSKLKENTKKNETQIDDCPLGNNDINKYKKGLKLFVDNRLNQKKPAIVKCNSLQESNIKKSELVFADMSKIDSQFKNSDLIYDMKHFPLTQNVLIILAMCLGCDYTIGIHNVGIVNSVEIATLFNSLPKLREFKEWVYAGLTNIDYEFKLDYPEVELKEFIKLHKKLRLGWEFPENFPDRNVYLAFTNPRVETKIKNISWQIPHSLSDINTFLQKRTKLQPSNILAARDRLSSALTLLVSFCTKIPKEIEIPTFVLPGEILGKLSKISSKRLKKALEYLYKSNIRF